MDGGSGLRTPRVAGLALVGAALAAAISACGSSSTEVAGCIPDPPPSLTESPSTPDVRVSEDGVLETTLRASYSPVTLDGKQYETMNFEGSVPGPTLVVCPGDKLIVHFENDLGDTPQVWQAGAANEHGVPHGKGQITNLHT
ncbi:MAG: multicopper oxidase domain-containing protein, partial [Chloroflexota bacterium]